MDFLEVVGIIAVVAVLCLGIGMKVFFHSKLKDIEGTYDTKKH